MDRRQRKSREAILTAFIGLLSVKDFAHITVGDIIDRADVGRATFYAHFETKDFLLKELCEELFCHVLDSAKGTCDHKHIFNCASDGSVFLHLFRHLQTNDNNILNLLTGQNNEIFLRYFKDSLHLLIEEQIHTFESRKPPELPDSFWTDHIAYTFVETVRWWIHNGMKESPETITKYFHLAV